MKTIFITGAVRNTGLKTAEKFASEGYNVAISSRNIQDAEICAQNISKKFNVKAKGYALDLSDVNDIRRVFLQAEKDFGTIDVFVANAANLGVDYGLLNSTEKDYEDVCNINIKGNFFACQSAAEIMKRNGGGSIVIIGSVHSLQAIHGRALYTMSKGALLSLVKSMAVELGYYGIRANYISAGAIRTERWDVLSDEVQAKRRERYPIGRESYPEEIAEAVYYLGSDLSKTVTGCDLTVDSGISVCLLPFEKPKE